MGLVIFNLCLILQYYIPLPERCSKTNSPIYLPNYLIYENIPRYDTHRIFLLLTSISLLLDEIFQSILVY